MAAYAATFPPYRAIAGCATAEVCVPYRCCGLANPAETHTPYWRLPFIEKQLRFVYGIEISKPFLFSYRVANNRRTNRFQEQMECSVHNKDPKPSGLAVPCLGG